MKIPENGNWSTEEPPYFGNFIVIESLPLMVSSRGEPSSYVYDVGTAIYDGEWDHDVYAWLDVEFPDLPKDNDGHYIPLKKA